jgi:phosphate-selective porin OprO and OprP
MTSQMTLAGVALGTFIGLCTASARAQDTASENRQLRERVKQLEAVVAKLSQAQKQMEVQVRSIAKGPTKQKAKGDEAQVSGKAPKMPPGEPPVVCKDQPCPPAPPPVSVSFTNGLKVEASNGDFSFAIGGRVLVDGGVSSKTFQGVPVATPPIQPVQAASSPSQLVRSDATAPAIERSHEPPEN